LLQRLLGNSLWQILDKVFRMGTGVLVSAYVARYLGPGDFGLMNFAVALTALFSAVAAFGLPSIVVRDLVQRPAERASLLASALLVRLAGGGIAVALAVRIAALMRPGDLSSLEVVAVVALAALPQAWDVIDYDYQSRMQARPIVIVRSISFAASAALRVGLVLLGAPLLGFAWAIVLEAALNAVLMMRLIRLDGLHLRWIDASAREVRNLVKASWPLVIAGLSVSVYMRIDQVMLGAMLGDTGVGIFSAAVRISEALYFLPVAVAASVAPALTAAHSRSQIDYERRFLQVTRLLVWLAIAVALGLALLSGPIIGFLYGARYAGAAPVLAIHAWCGVLVSFGVCGTLWLTNAGHFRNQMFQTMAGAGMNVALNLLLIPRAGVVGAAIASCAAQVTSAVLWNLVQPATRRLFRLQLAALLPGPLALRA
jgi:PST family polysaccharide transporter